MPRSARDEQELAIKPDGDVYSSEDASTSDEDEDDYSYAPKIKKPKSTAVARLKATLQQIVNGDLDLTRSDCQPELLSNLIQEMAADTLNKSLPTVLHVLLDDKQPDFADHP